MTMYIRTIAELGPSLILAPERYRAEAMAQRHAGIALKELVEERTAMVDPAGTATTGSASARLPLILDTTHVKDGRIDLAAALRATPSLGSAKRCVMPGDILVSRLRPYLRQIGYAHPVLMDALRSRPLLVSSEFTILSPRAGGESIAFLLPFLLGQAAQAILAAGQEGGHHPRVPRSTLLALEVPHLFEAKRATLSRAVDMRLTSFYDASLALDRTLSEA